MYFAGKQIEATVVRNVMCVVDKPRIEMLKIRMNKGKKMKMRPDFNPAKSTQYSPKTGGKERSFDKSGKLYILMMRENSEQEKKNAYIYCIYSPPFQTENKSQTLNTNKD